MFLKLYAKFCSLESKYNITLGNKTFQHDFVVCKHLMQPLILGREFLFKNELKVYYSKTGECRLDHKQEELVATVDSQDDLTLTLKSGIHIPDRTVAVLNVNSSVHQNDIGQFYNVRANSLLEDEYPQLQIVPTLHKVWWIQDFPLGGAPIYRSEPCRLRCTFIVIFTLFYINTNNCITLHSFIYLLVSLRF